MLADLDAAIADGDEETAALIGQAIQDFDLKARKTEAAMRLEAGKQAEADKLGPLERAITSFGLGVEQPHKQGSNLLGLTPDEAVTDTSADIERLSKDHFFTGRLPAVVGNTSQVVPATAMALAGLPAAGLGLAGQILGNAATGYGLGSIFSDPGSREAGGRMGAGLGVFMPAANKLAWEAERTLGAAADDFMLKGSGAVDDLISAIRNKFGSPREGGHALRELRTPEGKPAMPAFSLPETRLKNIKAVSEEQGALLDVLRKEGDAAVPNAVAVQDIVNRAGGVAAARNTAPERVINGGKTPAMVEKLINAFKYETRPKVVATDTSVEYPPPPQGNLPLSTMERPAPIGSTRAPDTVIPPGEPVQTGLGLPTTSTVATGAVTRETPAPTLVLDRNGSPMISRQGIGATVPGTKEAYSKGSRTGAVEGGFDTLPVKVESEQLGAIRAANAAEDEAQLVLGALRAEPRRPGNLAAAYAADDAATAARAQSDTVSSADDAGFIRDPQLRRNRLETGLTTPRPTEETGFRPVLNQEPDVTTASEIGYQPSLFSGYEIPPAPAPGQTIPGEQLTTELARQLRMGARGAEAFPPQGSVTPTRTNLKYLPESLSISDTAAFKTWLDNLVLRRASIANPNKPSEAIRLDPKLSALKDISNIFRQAEDDALFKALAPDRYKTFLDAKRQFGTAKTFEPALEGTANTYAAKDPGVSAAALRRGLFPMAGLLAGSQAGSPLTGLAVGIGAEMGAAATRTHGYPASSRLLELLSKGAGSAPKMSFVPTAEDQFLESLLRQR